MNSKRTLTLIILSLIVSLQGYSQEIRPFRSGERVVWVGDSITDWGRYHSYVWLFYVTRYPSMNLRMYNAGVGGDSAAQIDARLERDAFSLNPSYITLSFGMNDTGYNEYLKPDAVAKADSLHWKSMKSFNKIIEKLEGLEGTEIVMLSSSPFDNGSMANLNTPVLPGKNEAMARIAKVQKACAIDHGWGFADLHDNMLKFVSEQQRKDSSFTLTMDRVHPDNAGHMVLAWQILNAQGLCDGKVADLTIKSNKKKKNLETDNCRVTNLKTGSRKLSFDYLAKSLPYPMDTIAHGKGRAQSCASSLIPQGALGSETFCIKKLKSGRWYLYIDGSYIGRWKSGEWEQGVDIASHTRTPQYAQAMEVMRVNEQRWECERAIRRSKDEVEKEKLKLELESLVKEMYRLAQPVTRHVELTRKKKK